MEKPKGFWEHSERFWPFSQTWNRETSAGGRWCFWQLKWEHNYASAAPQSSSFRDLLPWILAVWLLKALSCSIIGFFGLCPLGTAACNAVSAYRSRLVKPLTYLPSCVMFKPYYRCCKVTSRTVRRQQSRNSCSSSQPKPWSSLQVLSGFICIRNPPVPFQVGKKQLWGVFVRQGNEVSCSMDNSWEPKYRLAAQWKPKSMTAPQATAAMELAIKSKSKQNRNHEEANKTMQLHESNPESRYGCSR